MNNNSSKMSMARFFAVLVSVIAIAALVIGGTYAYLTSTSDEVKNRFSLDDNILVTLTETTSPDYKVVPGTDGPKDPKVKVTSSLDTYAFVEITEQNTDGVLTYVVESGWTPVAGTDNIYSRIVPANSTTEYSVLEGDHVTYDSDITKENMPENVTLTFLAYAIQKDPFTSPEQAWRALNGEDVDTPQASIEDTTDTESANGIPVQTSYLMSDIGDISIKPTISLKFEFDEDEEDIADTEYANWNADFVISFDKDIASADLANDYAGQVVLYGNYAEWGNVPMFIIHDYNDPTKPLPANTEYRLLHNLGAQYAGTVVNQNEGTPLSMTCAELESYNVSPFLCGITVKQTDDKFGTINAGNNADSFHNAGSDSTMTAVDPDTKVTLKLNIYERGADGKETGVYKTCAVRTFTIGEYINKWNPEGTDVEGGN